MAKKKLDFESGLRRLQQIIGELESDETTLKQTVELYDEGAGLLDTCIQELKGAELKISELKKKSDGVFELIDTHE